MIALHRKKRVEIVLESARAPAMIEMIERAGARGYTVLAEVAGKGNRGLRDEAHISGVFGNKLIIVIADAETAARIVEGSQTILEHYAGIVAVSDVEVVRGDHF